MGVYAGSQDSYNQKDYKRVLEEIIDDYHGYKPARMRDDRDPNEQTDHRNNLNADKMDKWILSESEQKYVNATCMRLARNLEGTPLCPAMSRDERISIMETIEEILMDFDDKNKQFRGKFYRLEEVAKLKSDHDKYPDAGGSRTKQQLKPFLFVEMDKHLDAAGFNNDWPSGRAVFISNDEKFVIFVNEEDQLRMYCTDQGCPLVEMLGKMKRIENHFRDKGKPFMRDKHYGFITASPTEISTGLHISIQIKLGNIWRFDK